MEVTKNAKAEAIQLREKTTVYATAKAKQYKEGEPIVCHPKLAEHYIEVGFATEKPKAAKKD